MENTVTQKNRNLLSFLAIAAAACLLYGVSSGIRANYGIMLQAIVDSSGVSYEKVSFVIAFGHLMVGVVQPFFGAFALKKSNALVLVTGLVMMILGLGLLPF